MLFNIVANKAVLGTNRDMHVFITKNNTIICKFENCLIILIILLPGLLLKPGKQFPINLRNDKMVALRQPKSILL